MTSKTKPTPMETLEALKIVNEKLLTEAGNLPQMALPAMKALAAMKPDELIQTAARIKAEKK